MVLVTGAIAGAVPTLMRAPAACMAVEAAAAPRTARWKPGEVAPTYLDGSMAGDAGFDPLCLVALAEKRIPDLLSGGWPSMTQRSIIVANMTPEQQQASLRKMREAEIKHAHHHDQTRDQQTSCPSAPLPL